jgi:hypothetical protein
MDDSYNKDYIKQHIHELNKIISEFEDKDGVDKESLLDFMTVITTVLVKLNQDVKKLS